MITGVQLRSARSALRWSIAELANFSGVSVQTIMRFETAQGIPSGRTSTLSELKKTLEEAGIEFIGTPEDGPGIRLRRKVD